MSVGDIMYMLFDWCGQDEVIKIFHLAKYILTLIRWIVPIGLIVMTSWDLFTKVLNPDNKDAQKKIMNRAVAAVIVFFIPTIVNIVMWIFDQASDPGKSIQGDASCVSAWRNS